MATLVPHVVTKKALDFRILFCPSVERRRTLGESVERFDQKVGLDSSAPIPQKEIKPYVIPDSMLQGLPTLRS
jgi:hypothetical protein